MGKKKLDFSKIIKNSILDDLNWFEDEMNELYLDKDNYTKKEIKQAINIIDQFRKIIDVIYDKQVKDILKSTLKRIENKYPEFLSPYFLKNS